MGYGPFMIYGHSSLEDRLLVDGHSENDCLMVGIPRVCAGVD